MLQSELPICLQYLQALALPVLAGAGVWIAFVQARTSHEKLRLDLFDRRMQVFSEVDSYISKILREDIPDNSDIYDLYRAMGAARLLFEPEVGKFLDKINAASGSLRTVTLESKNAIGEELEKKLDVRAKYRAMFESFSSEIVEVFGPYMEFKSVKKWKWP